MPYIRHEKREQWYDTLTTVGDHFKKIKDPMKRAGEVNYLIYSILLRAFPEREYSNMALVDGIVANIGREYYRRQTVPYEEEKIKENGDIFY